MEQFIVGQHVQLALSAVPAFAELDAIGVIDSIRPDGLYNVNFGDEIGYIVCEVAADQLINAESQP